jgi:hypothetical protein
MGNYLFVLLAAVFICLIVISVLQKQKRKGGVKEIPIKQRKDSGYAIEPLNLALSKKQLQNVITPDYSNTVPPSRRTWDSSRTTSNLWKYYRKLLGSRSHETRYMLPMDTPYHDADGSMMTPCGFSIDEIRALGDFPDYAELSGVPLPKPYLDFDISRALPRPYRPFRWAYHQTMCR